MDKLHDGSIMRRVNMLGENLAEPSKVKVDGVVIPPIACEQIIEQGLKRELINAGIGQENKKSEGRSTKVSFIDNAFLKLIIENMVKDSFPEYTIEEAEDLQFAVYEKGDFYGLHKDSDEKNKRVLSVSVQLSEPSEYEGGELVFEDGIKHESFKQRGVVIIFPSNLYHQVLPITKGTRYSLVQWFKGYESSN